MDIVDALDAETGTTCVVGAGGKKTTLAALSSWLERAVVTATVRIPIFDDWVARVAVAEDPVPVVESTLAGADGSATDSRGSATDSRGSATDGSEDATDGSEDATDGTGTAEWPLGVVPEREEKRDDRYLGYDPETVDRLSGLDVPVLVKADGARMRRFKAPSDREPQLPAATDTVVPIASVHVVGEPLSEELVHRVEEAAAITGLDPGDEIRPRDVAAVLASDRGGRKDVPNGAQTVPLLNMVDDADLAATAREVAEAVHDRADVPRVVLAEMRADDPVVDIV